MEEAVKYSANDTIVLRTIANTTASNLSKDRDFSNRTWRGNYNELIIYSTPLVESKYLEIESNIYSYYNGKFKCRRQ